MPLGHSAMVKSLMDYSGNQSSRSSCNFCLISGMKIVDAKKVMMEPRALFEFIWWASVGSDAHLQD